MNQSSPISVKRLVSIYLPPLLSRQLRIAAAMEETSMSGLVASLLEERLPSLIASKPWSARVRKAAPAEPDE